MLKKTAFIDSDFMPPTAERFCLIPDAVIAGGFKSVCIKIIDNYPWVFDSRMKSDTAFDEKVVDFLSKKCCALGLKLIFVFPGVNNFSRLLRQNGYRHMIDASSAFIKIDVDAVGFNSLIELIIEDFVSLCPDLSSVAVGSVSEFNQYNSRINDILEKNGIKPFIMESLPEFVTVNQFLGGSDSKLDKIFFELKQSQQYFSNAVYDIDVFLTMSSLGRSMPAADSRSLNSKYCTFLEYRDRVNVLLDEYRIAAIGKIDEEWLEVYMKSIRLTVNNSCDDLRYRLKRCGLLN